MSSTPRCPPDPELKNIIDKLAQFVARNGPEFEQMTKTKQRDNAKFSFLFGGEFYAYYNYKVHTEQARFRLQQQDNQHSGYDAYQGGNGQGYGSGPPQGWGGGGNGGQGNNDWNDGRGGGFGGYGDRNGQGGYGDGGYDRQMPPVGPGGGGGGGPPSSSGPRPLMDIPTYPPEGAKGSSERHDSGGYDGGGYSAGSSYAQPPPTSEPPPINTNAIKEQIKALNEQQKTLREQIAQSEQNLTAQHAVTTQQENQLAGDTIKKAKRERLELLAGDVGVDMEEMETVLHPLIESCTKDTISQGKSWIFATATSHDRNQLIAHYLAFRVTQEDAPFNTKLHLIYLMNDVLHHCVRKHAEELKDSFESVAVEMFSAASFSAVADKRPKLDKLIKLWEDKSIFSATTIKKMREPEASWRAYQVQVKEDHAKALEAAAAPFWTTYHNYKKQHTTFVNHANSSIQSIESQKLQLEEQIKRAEALASRPPPTTTQQPPPKEDATDWSKKAEAAVSILSKGTLSVSQDESPAKSEPPKRTGRSSRWDTTPKDMPNQPPPQQPPPQGWSDGPPPGFGNGPPPGGAAGFPPPGIGPPGLPLPDLSRPPPGFAPQIQQPVFDEQSLIPTLPYFDLPAGLMVPMVKLDESGYAHPLDPAKIRLPPPTPPTEKLLAALELFYAPPSHERPRDPEGWEVIGLYEWNREKTAAIKKKAEDVEAGNRERSPTASPEPFTREPTPEGEGDKKKKEEEEKPKKKRYRSRSRSRTRSRSRDSTPERRQRSRTPSPTGSYSMPSYLTKRSPSPKGRKGRSRSRSRSRSSSPSPKRRRSPPSARRRRSISPPSSGSNFPGFGSSSTPGSSADTRLDSSNKGHQMMQKMGWKGSGLGSGESGIVDPISGGEVRDKQDKFRGVGVRSDPFEAFRKAKSGSFYHRMKERDGKKKQ